jgi:enamine deaminase RidA (YjgF/YER057c/UK114 family)/GNAT superfamily N-acetyltransferase
VAGGLLSHDAEVSDDAIRFIRPPALSDRVPYAYAAAAGADRVVWTAGACPLDPEGRTVAVGDVTGQAEQVMTNLVATLREAGAELTDVVKTTVFVATQRREDLTAAWDVVRAAFGDHDAPSTLLGVTALGWPDQLVEVEAVAVLPRVHHDLPARVTSGSEPVVVPAGPGDADAVAELFLAARAASMPYLPVLHTDVETRWWVANAVLPEHEVHLVRAGRSGRLLGLAAVRGAWLEHLYVAPAEQGRGLGGLLLEHVVARHGGELLLRVFQRNDRARRFYERHGFALVDVDDGSRNEEGEPDATYRSPPRTP